MDTVCLVWLSFKTMDVQDERERLIVRRFKFEELRLEQIQDLEVYFCQHSQKKKKNLMDYYIPVL